MLDIGAASSNPDSKAGVAPEIEIARPRAIVAALKTGALSIDTFSLPVQRWALKQDVAYLNDIEAFRIPNSIPVLARVVRQADRHAFGPGARRRHAR